MSLHQLKPAASVGQLLGRPHSGRATTLLRISPELLLTGGDDGNVVLWADGHPSAPVELGVGSIRGLACLTNGVAAGGERGLALLEPNLSVRCRIDIGCRSLVALDDTVFVGGADGAVTEVDIVRGDMRRVDKLPNPVAHLLAVDGGVAACDGRNLVWCRGDERVCRDMGPLAPDEPFYQATLHPHPDPESLLVQVDYEAMLLYSATEWLKLNPRTGAIEAQPVMSDGPGGILRLTPDGLAVVAQGRGLARVGFDQKRKRWDLVVPGVQFCEVIAEPAVVHAVDATGALRRFDLKERKPALAGRLVVGADAKEVAAWEPRSCVLRWWSLQTGALSASARLGYCAGQTVHRSPKGYLVARGDSPSAGSKAKLVVHDALGETERTLATLWNAAERIDSPSVAAVSPDGRLAAVVGRRWRLRWPEGPDTPVDHRAHGVGCDIGVDRYAFGGEDGHLAVWSREGRCIWADRDGAKIVAIGVVSEGDVAVIRYQGNELEIYDSDTGALKRSVPLPFEQASVPKIVLRPDSVTVIAHGGVSLWDGSLTTIEPSRGLRLDVLDPTGRFLSGDLGYGTDRVLIDTVSGSIKPKPKSLRKGMVKSWELPSRTRPSFDWTLVLLDVDGIEERSFIGPFDYAKHIGFSGDKVRVLSLSKTSTIDLRTGEVVTVEGRYQTPPQPSLRRAKSPDGALSARAEGRQLTVFDSSDRALCSWQAPEEIQQLQWPRADRLAVVDTTDALTLLAWEPS